MNIPHTHAGDICFLIARGTLVSLCYICRHDHIHTTPHTYLLPYIRHLFSWCSAPCFSFSFTYPAMLHVASSPRMVYTILDGYLLSTFIWTHIYPPPYLYIAPFAIAQHHPLMRFCVPFACSSFAHKRAHRHKHLFA